MNLYNVTLEWQRSSRQAAYSVQVEAVTQAEAKLKATGHAKADGWVGNPIKQRADIVREVAA